MQLVTVANLLCKTTDYTMFLPYLVGAHDCLGSPHSRWIHFHDGFRDGDSFAGRPAEEGDRQDAAKGLREG